MTLELTSPAFSNGAPIPRRYSCDGEDISPPLAWRNAPAGTQAFALIMDDPDAPRGTWTHWVLFDIPASVTSLPEKVPAVAAPPGLGTHGKNSWGRLGYGGPCPPRGVHRYFFRLYALDAPLKLGSNALKEELLQAASGHILAQGQLLGVYERK